jgi:hypothetical protein
VFRTDFSARTAPKNPATTDTKDFVEEVLTFLDRLKGLFNKKKNPETQVIVYTRAQTSAATPAEAKAKPAYFDRTLTVYFIGIWSITANWPAL